MRRSCMPRMQHAPFSSVIGNDAGVDEGAIRFRPVCSFDCQKLHSNIRDGYSVWSDSPLLPESRDIEA